MAIFGMGAWWGEDMYPEFIKNKVACIGYRPEEADSYYQIFRNIKVGDIIYIKYSDRKEASLTIRAIGIVMNNEPFQRDMYETKNNCIEVEWIELEDPIHIDVSDTSERKNGDPYIRSVFGITLYEEYNPYIQQKVIESLLQHIK